MTATFVTAMLLGGLVTLAALAVVAVRAADRLRLLADRLLLLRDLVVPAAEQLQQDADRARAHAERLRASTLRPGDGPSSSA